MLIGEDMNEQHPLAKGPIFDENGLLSDQEQLRAIIRSMAQTIENIGKDPRVLLVPNMREALQQGAVALHEAVCPDCAQAYGRGLLPTKDAAESRATLNAVLRGMVLAEDIDRSAKEESTLDVLEQVRDLLYGMKQARSTRVPTMGSNPYLQ